MIDVNETLSEDKVGGIFEGGTVNMKTLIDKHIGAEETRVAIVTFPPGSRTKVHVHNHEQILYILSGKGIVANEREEYIATPGKVFLSLGPFTTRAVRWLSGRSGLVGHTLIREAS